MARLSLAGALHLVGVSISGSAKGIILKVMEDVLKSETVQQAFQTAPRAFCAKLKDYAFYSTQGANLEGWLTHAKGANEPIGLLVKTEEIGTGVCKLGVPAKDKPQPAQVIYIHNPALAPGKRLGNKASCSSVKNLKIVMSTMVQGKVCYFFLPFTDEGESYRRRDYNSLQIISLTVYSQF